MSSNKKNKRRSRSNSDENRDSKNRLNDDDNMNHDDNNRVDKKETTESQRKRKSETKPNHTDDTDEGIDEEKVDKKEKKKKKKSKRLSDAEEEHDVETSASNPTLAVTDDKDTSSNKGSTDDMTDVTTTTTTSSSNVDDKPNFYSSNLFKELPLSDKTLNSLEKMQFTRMTQIQSLAIPSLLSGKDLIGAAKTGSGKTLAFLIPCIELLYKSKFTNKQGTGIIVIAPTRELAMQIYGVLQELFEHSKHTQTYGLIMGGANRKTEADKLSKGINIIVCTPGRLLDHLQNTKMFNIRNLLALVIDEADRILEQGFEDDLRSILKLIPKERQTMLFSATQTKKVDDLIRLSIDTKNSIFVDIPTETNLATASGLEQGYITCPADQRFLLLFTFLKKNYKKKKVMVFFSSCNSVKFHSELLNYIDIPCMDIHGKQKQMKRTTTFFTYCKATTGILLCTDVAARGLDIPDVDWIIQYDPPDDPKEYIHRVGRTARGATGKGHALLFLLPNEILFLKYLKQCKVLLNEYEFPLSKISNIQNQLQRLIESNYYLNRTARDAYRSYLLAYTSHTLRDIYDVHSLDLQAVCKAFGFTIPPRVDIPALNSKGNDRNEKKKSLVASHHKKHNMKHLDGDNDKDNHYKKGIAGHAFSASNPYGKRTDNDKRQFTH